MTQPFLPFALPLIESEEIDEVVDTLKSGWITTGPKTQKFEEMMKDYIGCKHAIAVNSCTAALHLSLLGWEIGPGDEVITTPLTFAATINTILHVGATPILADIDFKTGNIDPVQLEKKITKKTKAIVPVHYAGLACDLKALRKIADQHKLIMIEDSAHAIGTITGGEQVGKTSEAACFSFYPIKNMTTGEGGLVATNNDEVASRIRAWALHGMSKDAWARYTSKGRWYYEIVYPGFKYNMTDIQAALGIVQLRKLEKFIEVRNKYADIYRARLGSHPDLIMPAPAAEGTGERHTHHLFVLRLKETAKVKRDDFIDQLKDEGIGATVNYIPIPMHPYYRDTLGWKIEEFPNTKKFFEGCLSIPLYPKMQESDVHRVADTILKILS